VKDDFRTLNKGTGPSLRIQRGERHVALKVTVLKADVSRHRNR